MKHKEIAEYLDDFLFPREKNGLSVITCPNCKSTGLVENETCPICEGDRFINPKTFIKKHKEEKNG